MDEKIEAGDMFDHIETGCTVIVVVAGQMKIEDGPWYDSVTYYRTTDPERTFTRSRTAFRKKFVACK